MFFLKKNVIRFILFFWRKVCCFAGMAIAMDVHPETVFEGIQGHGTEITFSGEHADFIGRSASRLGLRVFLIPGFDSRPRY
jgi:hypothetical protein